MRISDWSSDVCSSDLRAEQHITSGLVAVLFALLIVPNTLLGRAFLKTPLEGRFLAGAGIAIVGVGLMILHEYRAAAVGAGEVLLGTARSEEHTSELQSLMRI